MLYTCCHTLEWVVASLVHWTKISMSRLRIMTRHRNLSSRFGEKKVTKSRVKVTKSVTKSRKKVIKSKTLTLDLDTLTPTMTLDLDTLAPT